MRPGPAVSGRRVMQWIPAGTLAAIRGDVQ
jgi:hypothetical protein